MSAVSTSAQEHRRPNDTNRVLISTTSHATDARTQYESRARVRKIRFALTQRSTWFSTVRHSGRVNFTSTHLCMCWCNAHNYRKCLSGASCVCVGRPQANTHSHGVDGEFPSSKMILIRKWGNRDSCLWWHRRRRRRPQQQQPYRVRRRRKRNAHFKKILYFIFTRKSVSMCPNISRFIVSIEENCGSRNGSRYFFFFLIFVGGDSFSSPHYIFGWIWCLNF